MALKLPEATPRGYLYVQYAESDIGLSKVLEKLEAQDIVLTTLINPLTERAANVLRIYERLLLMAKYNYATYMEQRVDIHISVTEEIKSDIYLWFELLEHVLTSLPPVGAEDLALAFSEMMRHTLHALDRQPNHFVVGYADDGRYVGIEFQHTWVKKQWAELGEYMLQYTGEDAKGYEVLKKMQSMRMDKATNQLRLEQNLVFDAGYRLAPFVTLPHGKGITWANLDPTVDFSEIRSYPVPHWASLQDKLVGERRYLPEGGVLVGIHNVKNVSAVWINESLTPWGTHYVIFNIVTRKGTLTHETPGFLLLGKGSSWAQSLEHENKVILFAYELYMELTGLLVKDRMRKYAMRHEPEGVKPPAGYTYVGYTPLMAGSQAVEGSWVPETLSAPPWGAPALDRQWEWATGVEEVLAALEGRREGAPPKGVMAHRRQGW